MTGHVDDVLATIDEAIAQTERRSKPFDMPELLRIKGYLLASCSPADERNARRTCRAQLPVRAGTGPLLGS